MSKMHYFRNTFFKTAKRSEAPCPNLWCWWPEVAWFGQIVVFKTDYDETVLKKSVITSFHWRHH